MKTQKDPEEKKQIPDGSGLSRFDQSVITMNEKPANNPREL